MKQSIQVNKIAQMKGHEAAIYSVIGGQNETEILSGAGEGWVVSWRLDEPENGKLLAKVERNIFSLAYLKAEDLIIAGDMDGGVHWIDLGDEEQSRNIAHHENGVFDILRIGDSVLTAGGEGMLSRWSIEKKMVTESFHMTNNSLRTIAYSAARDELAIGASDYRIYILNASDFKVKKVIRNAHGNSVFALKYSPDDQYLISGGRDAILKVWDIEKDWTAKSSQPAHWFTINDIAFHPAGNIFATASRDKTIKIWDAHTFKLLKVLDTIRDGCHVNSVNKLFWSTYNNYLVSCSDDRSIILWEIKITSV